MFTNNSQIHFKTYHKEIVEMPIERKREGELNLQRNELKKIVFFNLFQLVINDFFLKIFIYYALL